MFARQTLGWVGFDIGATSVKTAQVLRTDAGYRIHAAAVVPRSERWPAVGLEAEPLSSSDEVSAAASLCETFAGRNAASLLPIGACDFLHIDPPASSRSEGPDIVRAMESETQRPMRDRVYDYWPAAGQANKLNVIAAPESWSERISADVAESGWRCRVIDSLPWALARAASLVHGSETGRPMAALDWAYGRTTVVLVQNGAPTLVRALKGCGFSTAVDAIATGLRLSQGDAETLLHRHGFESVEHRVSHGPPAHATDRPRTVIEEILEGPLERMAQELRRTFDYWRGITRGQSPAAISIFGGGGTLAGVGPRLSDLLGIAASPWNLPWANPTRGQETPACLFGAAAGLSALAWEVA